MLAGYLGGWVDGLTMRIWDSLMAFPGILLGIAIAAMMGPGLFNAAIAVGIMSMPGYARMARAGMLSQKGCDYVLAARALGYSQSRIVFRHVLPNALAPILTQVALGMAGAVFLEAGMKPPGPRRSATTALVGVDAVDQPALSPPGALVRHCAGRRDYSLLARAERTGRRPARRA